MNGEQQVVLVRHADTSWSEAGRHTGTTDLPLIPQGRRKARLIGTRLRGQTFARVLTSPLERATETCRLADYGDAAEARDELCEWDYGDVLAFAHGHLLQALAVCWIGLPIADGRLFRLGTGSVSRLSWKREHRVLDTWNDTRHLRP